MFTPRKLFRISAVLNIVLFSYPAFAVCPDGDLNSDCKVNMLDMKVIAEQWLSDEPGIGDLDGLGTVDVNDLEIFSRNWLSEGLPLAINEFMAANTLFITDPQGDYDDWIEIYNYSDKPIDLGGMYLSDDLIVPDKWMIPTGFQAQTTVPANGFLLLWADGDIDDGPTHLDFKLSASGESIGLYDSKLNIIDSIADYPAQADDCSSGRLPDGSWFWQIFSSETVTSPTPGNSNDKLVADRNVIISEIMYHPSSENDLEEYIELYNCGSYPVSLNGWQITKGVDFAFGDITIAANSYFVIAADQAAFSAKYPLVTDYTAGWQGKLSNSGEKIELINSLGGVIDTVEYCDENEWSRRILGPLDYNHRGWLWSDEHDGMGKSLELINPNISNEFGSNWQAGVVDQGTPGSENSVWLSDTAPIIDKVKQIPAIPHSDESVVITARITDQNSDGTVVSLYYRQDESVYSLSQYPAFDSNDYSIVSMFDDGLHDDGLSGDGNYAGAIPAFADGVIVEYFVEAVDALGNVRTLPAPCDVDGVDQQVANRLYQVDDSYDPAMLWQASDMPVYYIIMTEAERERLEYIGSHDPDRYSNAVMNATFISTDGLGLKARYNVDVRNRGESSRRIPPNNYRVGFTHNDMFLGVSKINLNSKYTYLQLAGTLVFQMAGLPSIDAAAVQVRVNGENLALTDSKPDRMYGFYVRNEVCDDDWAEKHLPEDAKGNVYKASSSSWSATLDYLGTNILDYLASGYAKQSNEEENDWTDLLFLTLKLSSQVDENYADDLNAIADVDQWLRWFAVQSLIGNNETNLGNGYGDDYRMYCGVEDPRFILLPHDMDTVLGFGDSPSDGEDSIFRAARIDRVPVIKRLLEYPEFTARYYKYLKEYTETTFAPENMNPFLDQLLGGIVPQASIEAMKQFVADRNENVLGQIPQEFVVSSNISVSGDWPYTTNPFISVYGNANALDTGSVRVNGELADWAVIDGSWEITLAQACNPGLNRLTIETYASADGSGDVLKKEYYDVYYDDSSESELSGTLASDMVLDAASGPWHITGNVIVPVGVTLTIAPGTSLIFDADTGITVEGTIQALGTKYQRISMARDFGDGNWDGIYISDSYQDNQLAYVDIHYGDAQGKGVIADYSRLHLDNFTWNNTANTVFEGHGGQTTISNCYIPGMTGGSEPIHGSGLSDQEYLLLVGNVFDDAGGTNDILDWDPTGDDKDYIFVIDNVFLGCGDDGLDFDGCDAYVEGNIFMHFHNDDTTTTSNGVSGGESYAGDGNLPDMTIVRNVFMNCDNGILLKEGAYGIIVNNTFVNCKDSGVQLWELNGRSVDGPAAGAYIAGNIFWNTPIAIRHAFCVDEYPDDLVGYINPVVTADNNLMSSDYHILGQGNIDADPQFIDDSYDISAESPALATGPGGRDMGAHIVSGAVASGVPIDSDWHTSVELTVSGPAISVYQYSLIDNGIWSDWSGELSVDQPLVLTGLADGHEYAVAVRGRTARGYWAGNIEGNISGTWQVNAAHSVLRINEVAAKTADAEPDMIELYYTGAQTFDLSGYSLTDNNDLPAKYIFPEGTVIIPDSYLVIYADAVLTVENALNCGFSLDGDGDDIYLYDNAGVLVDSLEFGSQLVGYSLARNDLGLWKLAEVTIGEANVMVPTGNPFSLVINEWLADANVAFTEDFVELYNVDNNPVDLSGLFLTDNPVSLKYKSPITAHSFIAAEGYLVFDADRNSGAGHLDFHLDENQEMIALYASEGKEIDKVIFGPQTTDVSQGRTPDGADTVKYFDLPTPGQANGSVTVLRQEVMAIDHVWNYEQSGVDQGATWYQPSDTTADTTWSSGSALLYVESSSLPADKNTRLTLGPRTFYFRTHFAFDGSLENVSEINIETVIDDGAVIYLNGTEVKRIRIPEGDVSYSTEATSPAVGNAVYEYFTIPADSLVEGDNVLAAEVHQSGPSSSDVVFGVAMYVTSVIPDDLYSAQSSVYNSLRVSEIMYHSPAGDGFDYIELQNISNDQIDISGVRFTSGVDYIFPDDTLMASGEKVVVAADPALLAAANPQVPAEKFFGPYLGTLSNSSEEVVLKLPAPLSAAILRFEYKDSWYLNTDGAGNSLNIKVPTGKVGSWNDPDAWYSLEPSPGI